MISYPELLRFAKITTFRKTINLLKTFVSFYLSRFLGISYIDHLPFTLSFEPTTTCNLACPECPSGLKSFTRETGNASLSLYQKVLEESKDHLLILYLYFQGEPFIHKDFIEMIRMAHDRHIYTITSTNGHYLTPRKAEEVVRSGLDRILISIDGSTQDVYEQYRIGGNLEKVIEGTKNLVEAKQRLKSSHPEIVFQMLVVRPNELQISEVEKLATSLGVDQLVLKTAQVYDFENGNSLIPTIDRYARYKQMPNGKWKIKSELKNQCWKMWHSAVSTWDGQMIPCCFDKDAKYAMGNLQKETISEIWNNEKYKVFRSKILKSRSEIDICKNCSEGTKVWETVS